MHDSYCVLRADALLYLVGRLVSPWHPRDDVLLRQMWKVTLGYVLRDVRFEKKNEFCTCELHSVGMNAHLNS
jgi:hypothetical protein